MTQAAAIGQPMQLGIWLPVYGGWLRTREQPTGPDIPACLAIAQQAEALGFDFLYASENLLNCIHGPHEAVAEAWSLLAAIAATTTRVGLIGAVKPGFRSPFLVARMIDTLAQIAARPLAVNIVCGWWREEFELSGVPWLDHAGRYQRADAFLRSLHRAFHPPREVSPIADTAPPEQAPARRRFSAGYGLDPAALPRVWISGHSEEANRLCAEWGDCLFLNGMSDLDLARRVVAARQAAASWGRSLRIAVNAYVIATETRQQAETRYARVVAHRDPDVIAFFRSVMDESGAVAWGGLDDRQMVDSNAGFEVGLVGSFDDVQERLRRLQAIGIDVVVCQFDDPMRDAGPFMKHVIRPLRSESGSPARAASLVHAEPDNHHHS